MTETITSLKDAVSRIEAELFDADRGGADPAVIEELEEKRAAARSKLDEALRDQLLRTAESKRGSAAYKRLFGK